MGTSTVGASSTTSTSGNQNMIDTRNLTESETSTATSTAAFNGKAAEATMKQQMSALVGDGKNGQYKSHAETCAAAMAKYNGLTGTAKTAFAAKAAAIGAPLGLNFGGIKGADGKVINKGVELTGEAKETNARLAREARGEKEPVAATSPQTTTPTPTTPTTTPAAATPSPAPAAGATTRDPANPEGKSREDVERGLASIDTSGDGKISRQEWLVFGANSSNKSKNITSDAAYVQLDAKLVPLEKAYMPMPKAEVVDFLMSSDVKNTALPKDVAEYRR